jgi:hypothetical protein
MKNGYLTQQQIDDITAAIYNDNLETQYEDLPKDSIDGVSKEVMDDLSKGEEYIQVKGFPYYILTQTGQVINTRKPARITPSYGGRSIYIYISNKARVDFEDYFLEAGWEFDTKKILKNYKKYKWNIRLIGMGQTIFDQI